MATSTQHLTSISQLTRERALEFLGLGYSQERVAQTIGVTPGTISQLMAQEDFREAVRAKRTEALRKQTELDERYDSLESKLLDKLEKALPLMAISKTRDILDAIKTVNGAKRRGAQIEATTEPTKTVVLNMPVQILQHFTQAEVQKLPNNQIIKAGSQDLLTLTPTALTEAVKEITHDSHDSNEGTPKGTPKGADSQDTEDIPGKTRELCASDLE